MKEIHTKSTKKILNTQTTENKSNLILIIITLGAIVAAIAPFLHIFCSRESTTEIFGYSNMRMFLYSAGMPFTLFITSLILTFVSNYIGDKIVYKTIRNISFIILAVAAYYIVWVFWAKKDLNPLFYYGMLILTALSFSYFISKLMRFLATSSKKLLSISSKLPRLKKDIQNVSNIAHIMPSDNEDLVTYKAMVDVTSENLMEAVGDIKKDLN